MVPEKKNQIGIIVVSIQMRDIRNLVDTLDGND